MNSLFSILILFSIVSSALGGQGKVEWTSIGNTVDNGDLHNLLRCLKFKFNGKSGVLLWKSSGLVSVKSSPENNVIFINDIKIVFNEVGAVNYLEKDLTIKIIDPNQVKLSENIRDYVKPKLGIDLPIISFEIITL